MKIVVVIIFSLFKNLVTGLPQTWGARHAGSGVMDPCMKEKCPRISTSLLSEKEYYWKRKNMSKNEFLTRTANASFPAGEDYASSTDQLWRNKKIRKKTKNKQKKGQRLKRSQARTIISLNTNHTIERVKIDPKMFWSNKKCHKYAMFKVKKNSMYALIILLFGGIWRGLHSLPSSGRFLVRPHLSSEWRIKSVCLWPRGTVQVQESLKHVFADSRGARARPGQSVKVA